MMPGEDQTHTSEAAVAKELSDLGLTLDELDRLGEGAVSLEQAVAGILEVLLEPASGFERRVSDRVLARLHDRRDLAEFGELFGLAWDAARTIIEGDS